MASFKITDLTELVGGSVNDSDVLEIVDLDVDQSKKVTIASLKTVFSASEGSSYTGGTANGIMFNDGNTFGTSSNLVFDGAKLIINNPATNPATVYIKSDGTTGLGGDRVFALEGNLPEMWFKDTFGGGSGMAIRKYDNQFYIVNTNSSGAFVNYVSNVELSSGKWTIGSGNNPLGQLDVKVQNAGSIGQLINLANGQTEDAFQINSYGNTGGDLFRVEDDGKTFVNGSSFSGISRTFNVGGVIGIGTGSYQLAWSPNWTGGVSGIGTTSIHSFGIATAGVLGLVQDTSQNVGIGTTSPQETLHVDGTVRFENLPTSSAGLSSGDLWNDSGTLKIV